LESRLNHCIYDGTCVIWILCVNVMFFQCAVKSKNNICSLFSITKENSSCKYFKKLRKKLFAMKFAFFVQFITWEMRQDGTFCIEFQLQLAIAKQCKGMSLYLTANGCHCLPLIYYLFLCHVVVSIDTVNFEWAYLHIFSFLTMINFLLY